MTTKQNIEKVYQSKWYEAHSTPALKNLYYFFAFSAL